MTSSRLGQSLEQIFDIDSMMADIQRGIFPSQTFFGDTNITGTFNSFMNGTKAATNYSGATNLKEDLVVSREIGKPFRFTEKEYKSIIKRASSIASYGNIPEDVVEDFLMILCYIDKIEDMIVIADALQLPELNNPSILRDVETILEVPKLEKIAYMASAVEGLTKLFNKYIKSATAILNTNSGESIMDVIGSLTSGFGGAAEKMFGGTSPEELIGNFLSELVTGNRVPMNVITKNPNLQSPSYIGRTFFGEGTTPLSLVDIDQIFNKKLAVFPIPSAGAGTTSFGIQNLSSFTNQMDVKSIVGKLAFGTSNITPGSKKEGQIEDFGNKINNILGTTLDEKIDLIRGDNAIPIMQAFSAVFSDNTKSPFSVDTFKNAWMKSNAISNHLQNSDNNILAAIKRFA